MEDSMTIPCGPHKAQRFWIRQQEDRDRGDFEVFRHTRLTKRNYAPRLAARRLREYSLALARILSSEEQAVSAAQTFEQQFYEQAEKWDRETAHLSSPAQRFLHPSYVAIMGMAQDNRDKVIDLLLRDMRDNRREWFWALSYLTHQNPIDRRDSGRLDKMIKAWVQWGKQEGRL